MKIFQKLPFGMLLGGAVIGHGITAATLPILSRIYSPTDFGGFAIFTSVISTISVAACLRFDIAIALQEREEDAFELLALSLISSLAVSLFCLITLASLKGRPGIFGDSKNLLEYFWLIPVGVALGGALNAFQMWFVRKGAFRVLALGRVIQSGTSSVVQVALGLLTFTSNGLIFGYVASFVVPSLFFGSFFYKSFNKDRKFKNLGRKFSENKKFPLYSTLEALLNSGSSQLPIMLIAAVASKQEAGYLMMANYVMQAPIALLGTAAGQVYLSKSVEENKNGNLYGFTMESIISLIKIGSPFIFAAAVIAPFLFGNIFGREWSRSGELITWMCPWYLMQFITVPISMALHITGNQSTALFIQMFGFILRITVVVVLAERFSSAYISEFYCLAGFLFYLVYFLLIVKKIKERSK